MKVTAWFVFIVLIGFILTILPLPEVVAWMRPQWVLLILLFWAISMPDYAGIGSAFIIGILMDLLTGTVLGQHAMFYCFFVYLALKFNQQVRSYPMVQQMVFVGIITLFILIVQYFIQSFIGIKSISWSYWVPILSNSILWPWLCLLLQELTEHIELRVI